ncbi:hypothetical protein LUZ60_016425 [Juncus effusus]|nr:hypothetical protein LUZ60_016425 [Juncus effusus]
MEMTCGVIIWLAFLFSCSYSPTALATIRRSKDWPSGGTTRFYDFKVQTMKVTKLCNTTDIVSINGGPVIYAQEDDRVIVKKGTLFYHAHISWLRATLYGVIVIYPKTGVPYPFPNPYKEHVIIFGEWWSKNLFQLENSTLESGGGAPAAEAYVINGHPGPLYNCSENNVYNIDIVPGKTYLLRLINAALQIENFFSIAGHKLTVVDADASYTKPYTVDHLMLGPGQTVNILVTANQPIATYQMALGPYESAQNITIQNISSIAHFRYKGAGLMSLSRPAVLPCYNNSHLEQ